MHGSSHFDNVQQLLPNSFHLKGFHDKLTTLYSRIDAWGGGGTLKIFSGGVPDSKTLALYQTYTRRQKSLPFPRLAIVQLPIKSITT